MAVTDIFSKRLKRENEKEVDVYSYTDLPKNFRIQVIHIIKEGFGEQDHSGHFPEEFFEDVCIRLRKEYGVFKLVDGSKSRQFELFDFLQTTTEYDKALDVIEICFQAMNTIVRKSILITSFRSTINHELDIDECIDELNIRFRENGIGYRFESNQLIKIDSELLHKELIKPTLMYLSHPIYKTANDEFLTAFEHYRQGRNKECLADCLKSFESTLKIICEKQKWDYSQKDTASTLITIVFTNNLVLIFMKSQITALKSVLENGIPTLRNNLGGHGQGVVATEVDDSVANYALNLTASNIKFLISLEEALCKNGVN